MDLNTVPWSTAELVDFACLVVATLMVCAFPIGYGIRARLRDPLAASVILATSLTALAFVTSTVFVVLLHAGVVLPEPVLHWLNRVLVLAVGVGKVQLLWMLLRAGPPRTRRERESTAGS